MLHELVKMFHRLAILTNWGPKIYVSSHLFLKNTFLEVFEVAEHESDISFLI